MRANKLVCLLVLFTLWCRAQDTLDSFLDKYVAQQPEQKKWRTATVPDLSVAAAKGEAGAQEFLGLLYFVGGNVPQDMVAAAKWYRAAADQNRPKAQCDLGLLYANGLGVTRDRDEAVRWWRKSADQGFAPAMIYLAELHVTAAASGSNAQSNYTQAVEWFVKADAKGSPDAAFHMGELCQSGRLGAPRRSEASKWFRVASERGHPEARARLAASATGEERIKLMLSAAEAGSAEAQWQLAQMYDRGRGVPASPSEAAKWYGHAMTNLMGNGTYGAQELFNGAVARATGRGMPRDEARALMYFRVLAEAGQTRGHSSLGYMLASGPPAEQTDAEAFKWLEKAVSGTGSGAYGTHNARANLGYLYATGRGVKQDWAEAVKKFREALPRPYQPLRPDEFWPVSAEVNLGICLFNGSGVGKDEATATKHFRNAARRDDAQGQVNLGLCYLHGRGVEQDSYEAFMWFHLAAERKDPAAPALRDRAAQTLNETQRGEAKLRSAKLVEQALAFPNEFPATFANQDQTWNSGLRLPNINPEAKP